MRLRATELSAIRTTLGTPNALGQVYLYGSRADGNRRGGDIDLLVKTPAQSDMPIHQIARRGIRL